MLRKIFKKLEPLLLELYLRLNYSSIPNLRGDRDIEYSWILSNLSLGPGKALDFGCGKSYLALVAARKGFETIAIDLMSVSWFYIYPKLTFIKKDIFDLELPSKSLDLIINCSSIEHVGLVGRYGIKKSAPNGDIKAMAIMKKLLKPGGKMLLTIPVGQDALFSSSHRVYGKERLPKLLDGYIVEKKEYWIKDEQNRWILTNESNALNLASNSNFYGLGCFILKKKI